MRWPLFSSRATRGFTLVELLVVVSIIALLVSMLLPAMSKAREQAKTVVCQANMRSINGAILTYYADYDVFPLTLPPPDANGCVYTWCSWSYGGWLGKNPHWKTARNGWWQIPANRRPLTVYMNKGEVAPPIQVGLDPRDLKEDSGQPVFKCPSDRISTQWQWADWHLGRRDDAYSAYDDVGTSYQMNFYWWFQASLAGGVDYDGDGVTEPTLDTCPADSSVCCTGSNCTIWPCCVQRGQRIWKKYLQRGAARFVTIDEDPFDYAVWMQTQELGFHRQFSTHNLAFLDGHVAYLRTDTRQHWGPDWTINDEEYETWWP